MVSSRTVKIHKIKMSEEPEAYKIGWVPFMHAKIWLDSRPLIPRTETEFWTERAIEEIKSIPNARVLDLCAGSGAIGVAVLKELPGVNVDFIEKEVRHHRTIEKNINTNLHECDRMPRIFGGDLFESAQGPYDIILSNPPYIDPEKLERVQDSVIEHEPREALMGGNAGMEIVKRILADAPKYLASHGILYIEHEPEQVEEINKIVQSLPYSSCESFPDQYGVTRYSRLIRK